MDRERARSGAKAVLRSLGLLGPARRVRSWLRRDGASPTALERGPGPELEPGTLHWRCNICGSACRCPVSVLHREVPSCAACRSTVRMRAIVRLLAVELFGQSLALPDFPSRPDLRGVGLSDWETYAGPLAGRLGYTNTYYHKEPRLDIVRGDPAREGSLDFLVSTDVFEHVPPPISTAFESARRLLRPGGLLVFSVPYVEGSETREHFPELHRHELVKEGGKSVLRNVTRDGREQVFRDLVFHGGEGETLEMRVFSEGSLLRELEAAGFHEVRIRGEPDFEHGVYWPMPWSLPLTARRAT